MTEMDLVTRVQELAADFVAYNNKVNAETSYKLSEQEKEVMDALVGRIATDRAFAEFYVLMTDALSQKLSYDAPMVGDQPLDEREIATYEAAAAEGFAAEANRAGKFGRN